MFESGKVDVDYQWHSSAIHCEDDVVDGDACAVVDESSPDLDSGG